MDQFRVTVLFFICLKGICTALCAMPYNSENKLLDQPRPIYYNLTDLINVALKENNSYSHDQLKAAIQFSPLVLYETDILLDNIEEIIPLINLLKQYKANNGTRPEMMLTLRCVDSNGHFLVNRTRDAFYNLDKKLSLEHRSQLVNFVSAISLDFDTQSADSSYVLNGKDYLGHFSMSSSVRDFVHFQFGRADVSVGVIYLPGNYNWRQRNSFIINVAASANFTIGPVEFYFRDEFPMSYAEFNSSVRGRIRDFQNAVILLKMRNSALPSISFESYYYYPWRYFGSDWRYIGTVLCATNSSNTSDISQVHRLYSASFSVLTKLIEMFATVEKKDVVIGNPWQNFTQERKRRISGKDRNVLTQPLLELSDADVNVCKLRETLNSLRTRFARMGTDERTWRNIVQNQRELFGDGSKCINSQDIHNPQNLPVNVSIYFTRGISSVWQAVEPLMDKLIYTNLDSGDMKLKTLVFYEEDILASEQLQNFILKAKKHFTVGCSVSFKRLLLLFKKKSSSNPSSDFFKATLESAICSPLFQALNMFVWRIDASDHRSGRKGLFNIHYDISTIKEIFLREYPGKQVIMEYQEDRRLAAEIYNLTVSSPWTKMSKLEY